MVDFEIEEVIINNEYACKVTLFLCDREIVKFFRSYEAAERYADGYEVAADEVIDVK